MIHPNNILLNNRPLIEIRRDEVGGCPDDLDSPLVGLMVGFCALEGGEEGVVDVDDSAGHGGAERRGEDLHVPGQDDEVDVVFGDEVEDLGFLFGFCFRGDGEVVEGDVVG